VCASYQIIDLLGTGAFSTVYRASDNTTNMNVSIKVVTSDNFLMGLREVQILNLFSGSAHIVTFLRSFFFREHIFMITELLGQNVRTHYQSLNNVGRIAHYSEPVIKNLCNHVLSAVSFMHSLGVIHCDVKPDNICMVEGVFKVIDVGSAVTVNDVLNSYSQSRFYRAPEVILGAPYDHKIDSWSIGVSVVEVVIGAIVFRSSSVEAMLAAQVAVCGPMPQWLVDLNPIVSRMFFTETNEVYQIVKNQNGNSLLGNQNQSFILEPRTDVGLERLITDAIGDDYGDVFGMVTLMSGLLTLDPTLRLTAVDALANPWLQ
jgi:serine/threonine protein kinase